MGQYRIVAARPKNADNHLNSQFKVYEMSAMRWKSIGWKSTGEISALMQAGNEIRTGKIIDNKMSDGAAVELELRIAKNDTNYKISEMPDK